MNAPENDKSITVKFWGARGTLPVPGIQFSRYGGNTNCTEVTCGDTTIIFDAGTGIRELGSVLLNQAPEQKIHLMLTHAHYDHIEGLPFFAPFFSSGSRIDVYSGELDGISSTREIFSNFMKRPFFPVGPDVFAANVVLNDIHSGDTFSISDGIQIRTVRLNHPGGATGYRVDYAGKSFACITDTEHIPGKPDQGIIELIDGIDLFIYDASLTDEELPDFEGYGHSTFEEGLRLSKEAGAKAYMAFHHMPFRTDDELDHIKKKILDVDSNNGIAREGDSISLT